MNIPNKFAPGPSPTFEQTRCCVWWAPAPFVAPLGGPGCAVLTSQPVLLRLLTSLLPPPFVGGACSAVHAPNPGLLLCCVPAAHPGHLTSPWPIPADKSVLSEKKTSRAQPQSQIQTRIRSREVTKPTRIMNQDIMYKRYDTFKHRHHRQ